MLVLPGAGLVILENPKTATQSVRAMLDGVAEVLEPRHAQARGYSRLAGEIAARHGRAFETVSVVREPLDRVASWYRYRQRTGIPDPGKSTAGLDFETYLMATLERDPPGFARIGRQDRFTGWRGGRSEIDLLFDFARLDLLVAFLAERLGRPLHLPHRNRSPEAAAGPVSEAAMARFRQARAGELSLYTTVAAAGVLVRS